MKHIIKTSVVLLFVLAAAVATYAQSAIGTVVTLSGYILNGNTLSPVESGYSLYDATGKKVGQSNRSNANDGYLVTGLKPGQTYTIKIEDPRYFKQEFKVDIPTTSKYVEISKDFIARPMESGRSIVVQPIPFDLKKTDLKDGTESDINDMARMLIMNPSVNIEVVCYPDEEVEGTTSRISLDRGNALKAAFVKSGVSGERISVRAAPSVDPINPPPMRKGAKGKRYVGTVYLVITKV
ncbi:MAG: hypothetical protein SGJ05_02350 [bacterium]|nr:hypothetical protein [bacterium]